VWIRPSPPAETRTAAPACANVAENREFFQRPQETGFARDWVVADAVHRDQSPDPKFPANREIYREFFDFGRFCAILVLNRRANSAGYNKIPYATEQGIFWTEQGIFLREQGISAGQQGSGIGDQFQAGGSTSYGDETYRGLTEVAFAMGRTRWSGAAAGNTAVSARARASGAGATTRPARRTSGRRRSRVAVGLRRRP
jgi:hypothetical protein